MRLRDDYSSSNRNSLSKVEELSIESVVNQVLARNHPWRNGRRPGKRRRHRYPQVTSLEDPMVTGKLGPGSFGATDVNFAYMVEASQKVPFPGKLNLRGQGGLWRRPAPPSWMFAICVCD